MSIAAMPAGPPTRDPTIFGGGRYGIVPVDAIDDAELSFPALWLFTKLCSHADPDSLCQVTVARIAGDRGVTPRAVKKWITELELAGRLMRYPVEGKADWFRVVRDPREIGLAAFANRAEINKRREIDRDRKDRGRQVDREAGESTPPPVDNRGITRAASGSTGEQPFTPLVNSGSPPGATVVNRGSPITRVNKNLEQEGGGAARGSAGTGEAESQSARQGEPRGGRRAPRRPTLGQAEMLLPIDGGGGLPSPRMLDVLYVRFGDHQRAVVLTDTMLAELWPRRRNGTFTDDILDEVLTVAKPAMITAAGRRSQREAHHDETAPAANTARAPPNGGHCLSADAALRVSAGQAMPCDGSKSGRPGRSSAEVVAATRPRILPGRYR